MIYPIYYMSKAFLKSSKSYKDANLQTFFWTFYFELILNLQKSWKKKKNRERVFLFVSHPASPNTIILYDCSTIIKLGN